MIDNQETSNIKVKKSTIICSMNYFYKRIIKEFRVPPKEYAWERLIYHKGGFVIVFECERSACYRFNLQFYCDFTISDSLKCAWLVATEEAYKCSSIHFVTNVLWQYRSKKGEKKGGLDVGKIEERDVEKLIFVIGHFLFLRIRGLEEYTRQCGRRSAILHKNRWKGHV